MTPKYEHNEKGFTLVEMAMVLLVAGSIIAAIAYSFQSWDTIIRTRKTEHNMEIIQDALAAFATRNYRIPCPASPANDGSDPLAEPIGTELGSTVTGSGRGNCFATVAGLNQNRGLIPFITLGISQDVTRDGWHNPITFRINTDFAGDPEADVNVHAKCRTTEWIEGSNLMSNGADQWLDGGRNIAPQKARFCCRQSIAANRINIFTDVGPANPATYNPEDHVSFYTLDVNSIADPRDDHTSEGAGITPSDQEDPITWVPGTPNPATWVQLPGGARTAQPYYSNTIYGGGIIVDGPLYYNAHTDMPVYALISHGANEYGAFLANGTNGQSPSSGGDSETTNASLTFSNIFALEQNNLNNIQVFDDIVRWGTQSDLLARLNRDSCTVP